MTVEEFVTEKESDWSELDNLLARMKSGQTSALSADDLDRLGYLYRHVTSDLAIARRDFPGHRLIRHLNDLAARTHARVYQTTPLKKRMFRDFFRYEFPERFRESAVFTATAFLFFAVAFATTYITVVADPALAQGIVPDHLVETIERKEMWTNIPEARRNIAASFIMTNNIQVAFLAFALGITFTVGTVYILLTPK